jgi:hypothetical protein
MELSEALFAKKKDIVGLWIERTLDSYSSPGFFKKSSDHFANPVGSNISQGLSALYDHLLANSEQKIFVGPLDQVVRIRAVQDFTPSQAMAPFLELKWVIRQILSASKGTRSLLGELDKLDCQIDAMALAAFDIYTECREQLYRNRIRELKSGRAVLTDSACPSALMRQENGNHC